MAVVARAVRDCALEATGMRELDGDVLAQRATDWFCTRIGARFRVPPRPGGSVSSTARAVRHRAVARTLSRGARPHRSWQARARVAGDRRRASLGQPVRPYLAQE